jgi:DNA recombination protein RmuC
MREHCDFVVQTSVETEEGQRSRPDLLVRLPGGKTLVVDAKVPLRAYLEAVEAQDGPARERHLQEHARQVRDRMRELANKAYWSQFADAPDFVVMYVPDEAFLSSATRLDPDLLEDAWRRKVIPASPTILVTLLKTAHHAWQQERIAESAREISDLGRELYERTADLASGSSPWGGTWTRRCAPTTRRWGRSSPACSLGAEVPGAGGLEPQGDPAGGEGRGRAAPRSVCSRPSTASPRGRIPSRGELNRTREEPGRAPVVRSRRPATALDRAGTSPGRGSGKRDLRRRARPGRGDSPGRAGEMVPGRARRE